MHTETQSASSAAVKADGPDAYWLRRGEGLDGLHRRPIPPAPPGDHEVRIAVRAVSLNHRDLMIARGGSVDAAPLVPASDGAGVVVEVGRAVRRVAVGDRVTAAFYPDWLDGPPSAERTGVGLGGRGAAGWLGREVVLPEYALVTLPDAIGFAEAATIACAGVTAWHALRAAAPKSGDTVLLQGSGGVSVWALQLARAAGLRTIVTTSSAAKRERLHALGADATIDLATEPDWHEAVLRLTGGEGVDLALDVGGRGTLERSLAATRSGGTIAMVGGITGFGAELAPFALIDRTQRLIGVLVGHRAMTEDLVAHVANVGLRPAIDRVFGYDEARQAFEYLAAGQHVGKVVIDLGA